MYENETKIMLDEFANMDSDISRITNNAIHIYSHLMKCAYHTTRMNHGWINTIFKCCSDINRVPSNRIALASRNQNIVVEIKEKAIKEYHEDGNPNGEIEYNVVLNYFPTILDIANINKLKDYLVERAKDIGDRSAEDYINTGYRSWLSKR